LDALHGGILIDVAGAKHRKVVMTRLLEVCPDFGGAHVFAREDMERIDEEIVELKASLSRAFGRIKVLEKRVDEQDKQIVRMGVRYVRRGRGEPLSQRVMTFQSAG
jgi:hypothetical protein